MVLACIGIAGQYCPEAEPSIALVEDTLAEAFILLSYVCFNLPSR